MGEAMHVWGVRGILEIPVPPSQFYCKSKTALKNKVFKNTIINKKKHSAIYSFPSTASSWAQQLATRMPLPGQHPAIFGRLHILVPSRATGNTAALSYCLSLHSLVS